MKDSTGSQKKKNPLQTNRDIPVHVLHNVSFSGANGFDDSGALRLLRTNAPKQKFVQNKPGRERQREAF